MAHSRRLLLALALVLMLVVPWSVRAQVVPPPTAGGGPVTLPSTTCVDQVAVGMTTTGDLVCAPVTSTMTTGLVPAGVDVSASGQVTATHLDAPLPVLQGGLGLSGGIPGGLLYFQTAQTLGSTPTLAQHAPVIGGGAGQPLTTGTRSGTTLEFATVFGPHVLGKQLAFDVDGNVVATGADIGGTGGPGGAVSSVFGRLGAVVAQSGDYTVAQVTNAASLTGANVFTAPAGQTMAQLVLPGALSGTLTVRAASVLGTSLLVLPQGSTDLSASGGPGQVVRQSVAGGALSVSTLDLSELTGAANLCTTAAVCTGYQAALTFTPENVTNKDPATTLGTSNVLYPTQNAVKQYVDASVATRQPTLGFTPENVTNKATSTALGTSDVLYPTQNAVKSYVDAGLGGKQNTLGFTPENVTNKATAPALGTSDVLYPTQNAVKSYVDAGLGGKQNALGFTPENVTNKSDVTTLGISTTAYPTQNAVKSYVDAGLGGKQNTLGFTPENVTNKATAPALGTSDTAYPSQNAVKQYVDTGLATKQATLGFTPENVTNKATSTALGVSDVLYPSQNAVKQYVDTGLATKQATLGFTPESIANKASGTALGTSDILYPTQAAVKSYVDTGLATKQATLGFTPENVTNKATSTALGTSDVLYPTQNAVKQYIDTGLATKQATLGFTPESIANKASGTALGTSDILYPTQAAVKSYVDTGLGTKQTTVTWGAGLTIAGAVAAVLSTEPGFLADGGTTPLTCGAAQQGKMQVLDTGILQYCDGATTSVLQSGVLTQAGLAWNVTASACIGDANGGKLTLNPAGTQIVCASDIGGTGEPGGAVTSVFGRTGVVAAQSGDYTAAQVTNAADLTAANTFTHASGQTMPRLILAGATSGAISLRPPAIAGTSLVVLPAGSIDFTTTGGAGQVVRQSSLGSPFTVSQLGFGDLAPGTATDAQIPNLNTLETGLTPLRCVETDAGGKFTVTTGLCGTGGVTSVFGRTGVVAAQSGDYTAAQVTNAADLTAANTFTHASGQSMRQLVLPGATSGSLSLQPPAVAGTSIVTLPAGSTNFTTTGGTGQVLRQSSLGAPLTVSQLAFTDLAAGAATDTQIPDLNALSTGLPPFLCVQTDASGKLTTATGLCGTATGTTAFSNITGGPANTTAAMVIGSGASLTTTGTGSITATALSFDVATQTELDAHVNGTAVHGATSTNTLSRLVVRDASGNFSATTITAALIGNATTATGFQNDPQDCLGANEFARTIATNGNLGCVQPTFANLTGVPNAATDGTKGVVTFAAADFTCTTGLCSLNYATGQAASGTTKGFLTSGDWTTFNTKQNALGFTPENVTNKSTVTALGTSDVFYPTQNAVKVYVDTGLGAKQNTVVWGAGLAATGDTARSASQEAAFLADGGAVDLTCGAANQGKMQVLDNGTLQYCDGATTAVLQTGRLTPPPLTWNVTAATCTADGNLGKLTVNGTNQIVCAADQGGAVGITSVGNCSGGACFNGTTTASGTTLALYDGDSHAGTFQTVNLTAPRTYTLPNESGTLCTSAGPAGTSCSNYQAALGFTPVPPTQTVEVIGAANQIAVSPTGPQNLGANRTWTLTLPQNIDLAALVRFGSQGLGVTAPTPVGTLAQTAAANNVTLQTLKRAPGATGGNFVDYQTDTGTGLWTVNILGTLTAGSVPIARVAGAVATTRTLTLAGTTNQVSVTPVGAQDLSTDRTWTLTLPQNIDTAALVRHGSLGLGVAAPSTVGLLASAAAANNVTLLTLKRFQDTGTPTGAFAEYQNAAGTPLWRVDINGMLTTGTIPAARLSPVTGTGNVVLSTAPTIVTPQVTDTLLVDAVSDGITLLRLQRATDAGTPTGAFADYQSAAGASLWRVDINGVLTVGTVPWALVSGTSTVCTTALNCIGHEVTSNKSTNPALGTSNTQYPTLGAVKAYVDNGQKAMTNTALTPRQCTAGPGSPITINADNLTGCDFVQMADLSGATTFDFTTSPTPTYVNGQFLTLLIFTTTQRALAFTTGAGKFAAEGIALPTFSRTNGYVLYGFRYNALSNRWALAATNQETNYGTAGYVQTAGGPGVESTWQPPTGGGGTGERLLPITAVDFPATDPAILSRDTNGTAVLRFDNNTPQCVWWGPFRMNVDYASTPVFKFQYAMESVTGAFNVVINVSVMAITPGVDAHNPDTEANYATANTCTNAIPGTAKTPKEISCPLTSNDGLLARDLVKVKLCRGATGSDNAEGIMFGLAAALEYNK